MSTESKTTTPVEKKEEFSYKDKGTLVISAELQRKIEFLHKQVGPIEWCGVLFYKRLEGDIDEPSKLKLLASDLYLMDIGREAYTEADFDADSAVEMWETVNDDYTFKRGLIHTHHNMSTFFSGTDMSELHDNAPTHNYYLSLIVNFNGVWAAKVAFVAKRTIQMSYKNVSDEAKDATQQKEILMMIDMNIVKEQEEVRVPDFFRNRYTHIKSQREERAAAAARKSASTSTTFPVGRGASAGASVDAEAWEEHLEGVSKPIGAPSGPNTTGVKGQGAVTKEGNLQHEGKLLRPKAKVEMEILVAIIDWLNEGASIYKDMVPAGKFTSVTEACTFFNDYFNIDYHGEPKRYDWFSSQMQRQMEGHFASYYTQLIARVGMETLNGILPNNPVAADLYNMFEAYPQYVFEMEKATKKNNKNGKGRQKQHVNARRR